jgi:hypothetical protein
LGLMRKGHDESKCNRIKFYLVAQGAQQYYQDAQ